MDLAAVNVTNSVPQWVLYFQMAYTVMQPFIWPVLTFAFSIAVIELKRKGYQTTYIESLGRAVGAGVEAAKAERLDPFSGPGRAIVLSTGVAYMKANVSTAAAKLGITTDAEHETRVAAQLGSIRADALAQAGAVTTAVNSAVVKEIGNVA